MPKPPEAMEVETRKKILISIIPRSSQVQHSLSPQQLSFFTPAEPPDTISIPPCPRCGSEQAVQVPGTGPHYAGLRCLNCDRFIKWLKAPKTEPSQEKRGED